MDAVVGALYRVPELMSGQLASEGVALPPGVQPTVADVVVVVDRADVVARMAAAVPPGVVDGVDARIGPERVAVGCLGVLPGHIDEPGQPPDLSPAHVRVHVDRAVLVAVVEPEQLPVVEPVLLPGGRRVGQPAPRLFLHQVLPPLRALPGGSRQALIKCDRMAMLAAARRTARPLRRAGHVYLLAVAPRPLPRRVAGSGSRILARTGAAWPAESRGDSRDGRGEPAGEGLGQ